MISSGTLKAIFQGWQARTRTSARQYCCRRKLVEREIAADDGKCLGVFGQAFGLKALLGKPAARQVAARANKSGRASLRIFPGTGSDEDAPKQPARPASSRAAFRSNSGGSSKSGSVSPGTSNTRARRDSRTDRRRLRSRHPASSRIITGAAPLAQRDRVPTSMPARRKARRRRGGGMRSSSSRSPRFQA